MFFEECLSLDSTRSTHVESDRAGTIERLSTGARGGSIRRISLFPAARQEVSELPAGELPKTDARASRRVVAYCEACTVLLYE